MSSESAIENAAFAVSSRLISCLVTESLLRAFYLPLNNSQHATGILVVLTTSLLNERPVITRTLRAADVLAIVPLHHPPVLKDQSIDKHGRLVALVDPLDMLPEVYELIEDSMDQSDSSERDTFRDSVMSCLVPPPWELGGFKRLCKITRPELLWRKFVADMIIQDSLRDAIEKEILSSFQWQAISCNNPPSCPLLSSTPIEWEQSLVAGHPTHPMHRARMLSLKTPEEYDWYHPVIRFAHVPRASLDILGPFERELAMLAEHAATRAGKTLPVNEGKVIMPVHELQIPSIVAKFQDVDILDPDINVRALAQSSIRTVVIPELPGKALKLAINVKISSSLRTISHYTANFGPRFSENIVPKLSINPEILSVECEPASAVYRGVEPDVAKHFTAVLRNQYVPSEGENVIVVAALLESGHAGVPPGISAVQHAFKLDTEEKRADFLDRYIRIACEALVPPLLHNGVAFEAHAQNVLARFDIKTGQVLGFIVRDLGGLRIHPPTLHQSTGVDFEFLSGHCVVTKTLAETYPKFYHTFVHNHLQRLIRLLGMHYDGSGYAMLRRHLEALIPKDHALYKTWLSGESATVPGKCLMRMRLEGVYRDMVYSPFPNMIQYTGTSDTVEA